MPRPPSPRAPFRLRPSRRTILLACILLLAGAVVNVAVAWVLVGAPDSWTPGGPRQPFNVLDQSQRKAQVRELAAALMPPDAALEANFVQLERGLGWTHSSAGATARRDDGQLHWAWSNNRLEAGWPARSMVVEIRGKAGSLPTTTPSLLFPENLRPATGWFQGERKRLPLTPIPAGFAINTLFYTTILALPLSFFPIRRRVRTRRGRCPACGYDLTGAPAPGGGAGGGGVCPECGAS